MKMHLLTRSFQDRHFEKNYLRSRAEDKLNPITVFGVIGIAGLVIFAFAAYLVMDGMNAVTGFTLGIVIPILFGCLILGRFFFRGNNTFSEMATIINLAMITIVYNFASVEGVQAAPFGTVMFLGTGINIVFLFLTFPLP